jgi:glutamate-1-semialdehyde 2,1-aminomutase
MESTATGEPESRSSFVNAVALAEGRGQALYRRAREIIPGGAQLLGKRSEMYLPELWPAYYSRANGAEIWDLDGRRYLDFTMVGIGTSVLGYGDPDVEAAVIRAVRNGTMTTLNTPEEVELAELLLELHPWGDMVTYARTGGEMMTKAVRVARAATGRTKVAFSGYHGWHDWYLAANLPEDVLSSHLLPSLEPAGVPQGLMGSALPFSYNDIESLENLAAENDGELAAIVMEPIRYDGPKDGFLIKVRAIADRIGAVLIFDEITSGFRMNTGGAHLLMGVEPDVVTFAKTISNGVPMAAMLGRRSVMEAVQKTFMSSSYWTERVGPAAAVATIRKHRRIDAGTILRGIGLRVQAGWIAAAEMAGLSIAVRGPPALSAFGFAHDDAPALTTLFIQDMLDDGFLASDRFYPTVRHTPEMVEGYLSSVFRSFQHIARELKQGTVRQCLRGPVKHVGFGPGALVGVASAASRSR